MGKQKVTVTDNSIKSGVTSDANKAICEYIWNGFDAHAHHVSVEYEATSMGAITSLVIKDDGEGIDRATLSDTFGRYQDSVKKKSFQWSSQVKGHRGKGRYSFNCFATGAEWETVFRNEDGQLIKHTITINGDDNDHYNDHSDEGGVKVVHDVPTGTEVNFINVDKITSAFFESKDFIGYLQREFAVFLKLNENRGYTLTVNGFQIDCNTVIAEADTKTERLYDEKLKTGYDFQLTFIRWYEKMKENYSVYYLNEEGLERYEETTRLNKKDTGFHHSVYVSSPYFEYFAPTAKTGTEDGEEQPKKSEVQMQIEFEGHHVTKNEKDKVFKELKKKVADWLSEKQKLFIAEVGGKELWDRFETKGVVKMPENEYEQPLFNELKETVIGIYSVQPKLFTNLADDQAKALVGCLKLLLQTNKRDDVITILEQITKMSEEERRKLSTILKTTELSSITNTIDLLQNRVKTVSALKAMLFDPSLNAYEVEDVQKMVSSAFWLFGEQYNIVTEAEPDFQQALVAYLEKINKTTEGVSTSQIDKEKINHPDVNKEMDIFAFRQNKQSQELENIVVELKRPCIKLGEKELSQVKTYMRLIYQEPRFNSTNAKWTFILIGNDFDKSGCIEGEMNSNVGWGKKDLVFHVNNVTQRYEIYVKKWSTIFDDFEIRHKFLLDKLEMKRKELTAQYKDKEDLHKIVEGAQE